MAFLKPNIDRMKEKKDHQGLIKILQKPKLHEYHKEAALAVTETGSEEGLEAIEVCFNNKTLSNDDYMEVLEKSIFRKNLNFKMSEKALMQLIKLGIKDSLSVAKKTFSQKYITKIFYLKALATINSPESLNILYDLFMRADQKEQKDLSVHLQQPEFSSLPDKDYWIYLFNNSDSLKFKGNARVLETVLSGTFKKNQLTEKAACIVEEIADENISYLLPAMIAAIGNKAASGKSIECLLKAIEKINSPESFEEIAKLYPHMSVYIRRLIITTLNEINPEKSKLCIKEFMKTEEHPIIRTEFISSLGDKPDLETLLEHLPIITGWVKNFCETKFEYENETEKASEPIVEAIRLLSKCPEKEILEYILKLPDHPEQLADAKERVFGYTPFAIENIRKYAKEHQAEQDFIDLLIDNIRYKYVHYLLVALIKDTRTIDKNIEKIVEILTKEPNSDYGSLIYMDVFKFLSDLSGMGVSELLVKHFDRLKSHKRQAAEISMHIATDNPDVLLWRAIAFFPDVDRKAHTLEKLEMAGKEAAPLIADVLKGEYLGHKHDDIRPELFKILTKYDEAGALNYLKTLDPGHDFFTLFLNRAENKSNLEQCEAIVKQINQ